MSGMHGLEAQTAVAKLRVAVELNRLEGELAKARGAMAARPPGAPMILPPGAPIMRGAPRSQSTAVTTARAREVARLRKIAADATDPDVQRAYDALAAQKADGIPVTELEKISPTRVDGVKTPANGYPILMMKGSQSSVRAGLPTDAARDRDRKQQLRDREVKRLRRLALEASDPQVTSAYLELASEIARGARNP